MKTTSYSIINTTVAGTTFSTISLADYEVANALQTHPGETEAALRAATRAGLFSPVTATANDTVGVEIKPDGSAVILVESIAPPTVTITISDTASSSS